MEALNDLLGKLANEEISQSCSFIFNLTIHLSQIILDFLTIVQQIRAGLFATLGFQLEILVEPCLVQNAMVVLLNGPTLHMLLVLECFLKVVESEFIFDQDLFELMLRGNLVFFEDPDAHSDRVVNQIVFPLD